MNFMYETFAEGRVITRTVEWLTITDINYINKNWQFKISVYHKGDHHYFFSENIIDFNGCVNWLEKQFNGSLRTTQVNLHEGYNPLNRKRKTQQRKAKK